MAIRHTVVNLEYGFSIPHCIVLYRIVLPTDVNNILIPCITALSLTACAAAAAGGGGSWLATVVSPAAAAAAHTVVVDCACSTLLPAAVAPHGPLCSR